MLCNRDDLENAFGYLFGLVAGHVVRSSGGAAREGQQECAPLGGTSALVLFVVVFLDDFDGNNDDDDDVFGSFSPTADLESRGGFSVPA